MPTPITFTEPENRMLQELFLEMYQNDQVRSIEGPLILSILNKLELWPTAPTFDFHENRRLQVMFESFIEIVKPYPYPYSPLTFGQDTRQMTLIQSVFTKVKAAA